MNSIRKSLSTAVLCLGVMCSTPVYTQEQDIHEKNIQLTNKVAELAEKTDNKEFKFSRGEEIEGFSYKKALNVSLDYKLGKEIFVKIENKESRNLLRKKTYALIITDAPDKEGKYGTIDYAKFSYKDTFTPGKGEGGWFDISKPEIKEIDEQYNKLLEWAANNNNPKAEEFFNIRQLYKKIYSEIENKLIEKEKLEK
ncbi:MAG: hypothetical protein WC781_03075 [Candidatus Pacearchaeota archaeon]|jgi:hypothetical protein